QGPVAGVATGPVGPTSRTAPDDQPRGARRGAASSCWTRLSIWSSRWLACCADWLADSALCAALCTRESSWSRRELIVANSSAQVAQPDRPAAATIATPSTLALRCRLLTD